MTHIDLAQMTDGDNGVSFDDVSASQKTKGGSPGMNTRYGDLSHRLDTGSSDLDGPGSTGSPMLHSYCSISLGAAL